jgi:DNA-binding XRE family transcriptional regulator
MKGEKIMSIKNNKSRIINKKEVRSIKLYKWDYSKLRGRIKEIYSTQDAFAEAIGIGRVSLSQRLNGKLEFTNNEIQNACEVLNIETKDIYLYFFAQKV